jgi:hypothetical protein
MEPIGARRWAIAEGYIPDRSTGPEPAMISHETACILNTGDVDAHMRITVFFVDRGPARPYELDVPACRTRHVRFNHLTDPEPIPRATDYSSVLESNVPVVVQHTRLDSRQVENALLTTVAYPARRCTFDVTSASKATVREAGRTRFGVSPRWSERASTVATRGGR